MNPENSTDYCYQDDGQPWTPNMELVNFAIPLPNESAVC